jgi:hypothetical protein
MHAPLTSPGRLAANVMHFARVLRTAGMPVGTDRIELRCRRCRWPGSRAATTSTPCCRLPARPHRAPRAVRPGLRAVLARPRPEGRMRALLLPKVQLKDGAQPPVPREPPPGRGAVPACPRPPTTAPEPKPARDRRRADLQRPRAAAPGRLRDHERRRMARAQRLLAQLRPGLRAAAHAPQPPRRTPAARLARHAARHGRHGGELWDACAGVRRARGRRRWWCWPTSRAR